MDHKQLTQYIEQVWDESILPALFQYIEIPNKSPLFDKSWEQNGHMDAAMQLATHWCNDHAPQAMELEVVRLPGRTPLLVLEIPGKSDDTVLLYGHLDKQPEMVGWDADLGPWKPVLKGDKLYGRGGADDGYAVFASVTAINALQQQGLPHARCVVLIECCEESGSHDLPYYIEHLKERIGSPSLVVCLDSGCGNYEQLWMTTSLRGNLVGELTVELLQEGVHSGQASGVVPDGFRVIRQLLNRIENEKTGEVLLDELKGAISPQRLQQAEHCAAVLGNKIYTEFPWHAGVTPVTHDLKELILNRTWRPALAVTGAGGLPSLQDGGNVLRPVTSLKLSMRIPPDCDQIAAHQALKSTLERDPPNHAKVSYTIKTSASGWNSPHLAPWLEDACDAASNTFFGKPAVYMGEGATIPFMGMLGSKFPEAQFMITGVLGPHSNAHGPNEFLHIPMAKKLTACVSKVLHQHYKRL